FLVDARLRNVVARHQAVDDAVELLPRRLAVGVVAHDEGRPGVELLVLQVAAGELRSDEIPGELEKLHALHGAALRRLEVRGELARQVLVLDHRDVGRHLEYAPAAQRSEERRVGKEWRTRCRKARDEDT